MSQLWWIVFQSLVVSSNHVTTLHVQQWLMGGFQLAHAWSQTELRQFAFLSSVSWPGHTRDGVWPGHASERRGAVSPTAATTPRLILKHLFPCARCSQESRRCSEEQTHRRSKVNTHQRVEEQDAVSHQGAAHGLRFSDVTLSDQWERRRGEHRWGRYLYPYIKYCT